MTQIWRCSNCGAFEKANGEWRYGGGSAEHKCPHLPAQAGHFPAAAIDAGQTIIDLEAQITELEHNCSVVFEHATFGALSKINTEAAVVMAVIDDKISAHVHEETKQLSYRIGQLETERDNLRKRRDDLLVATSRLVEERRALVGLSSASCTVLAKEAYDTHQKAIRGYLRIEGWNREQQGIWESVASAVVIAVREHVARQEREKLIELLGGDV